jgi:hypothetical protein
MGLRNRTAKSGKLYNICSFNDISYVQFDLIESRVWQICNSLTLSSRSRKVEAVP